MAQNLISVRVDVVGESIPSRIVPLKQSMTVEEALASIQQKVNFNNADWGLYLPAGVDGRKGRWLKKNDKTLSHYDIRNGDNIEYRLRHRTVTVRFPDAITKAFSIDESRTVREIIEDISQQINISAPEEFGLQLEGHDANDWLTMDVGLTLQGVAMDSTLLFRKRLWFHSIISEDDTQLLNFTYLQLKDEILNGRIKVTQDQAVELAGIQLQAEVGKDAHSFKEKDYLSAIYRKAKGIQQAVLTEHRKFTGVPTVKAKIRYFQLCQALPEFGFSFFKVKERHFEKVSTGLHIAFIPTSNEKEVRTILHDRLLGISKHKVLLLKDKKTLKEWPISHLRRWAATESTMTLDFGEYENEYLTFATLDGEKISAIISGYINIHVRKLRLDQKEDKAKDQRNDDNLRSEAESQASIASQINVIDFNTFSDALLTLLDELSVPPPPSQFNENINKQAAVSDFIIALNEVEVKIQTFVSLACSQPTAAYSEFSRIYTLVLVAVRRGKPALLVQEDRNLFLAGLRKVIVSIYNCNLVAEAQTTAYPTGMGKGVISPLKERIDTATLELKASVLAMATIAKEELISDDASTRLIYETSVAIAFGLEQVLLYRKQAGQANAVAQKQLQTLEESVRRMSSLGSLLAISASDSSSRDLLVRFGEEVINVAKPFFGGVPKEVSQGITDHYNIFTAALKTLGTKVEEPTVYLQDDVKAIQKVADLLRNSDNNNPALVLSHVNSLIGAIKKLEKSANAAMRSTVRSQPKISGIIDTATEELKKIVPQLVEQAKANATSPSKETHSKIFESVGKAVDKAIELANNTLAFSIGYNLQYSAKLTCAVAVGLSTRALQTSGVLKDQQLKASLFPEQNKLSSSLTKLIGAAAALAAKPVTKVADTTAMFAVAREQVPTISAFIEFTQRVYDLADAAAHSKQQLLDSLNMSKKALRGLLAACRIVSDASGGKDLEYAVEYLSSASAELDAAAVDVNAKLLQLARVEGGKENALELLETALRDATASIKEVTDATKPAAEIAQACKTLSDRVGSFVVAAISFVSQLGPSVDRSALFRTCKQVPIEAISIANSVRSVLNDPTDASALMLLKNAANKLSEAGNKAATACRSVGTPFQGWAAVAEEILQATASLNEEPSISSDATLAQYVVSATRYTKVLNGALAQIPAVVKAVIASKKTELDVQAKSAAHSTTNALTRLFISVAAAAKKANAATPPPFVEKAKRVGQLVHEIFVFASKPETAGRVDAATTAATDAVAQLALSFESGVGAAQDVLDALNTISQAVSLAQTHRGAMPNCPIRGTRDIAAIVKALGDSIGQTLNASISEKDKVGGYCKQVAGLAHNLLELSTIFNQFYNYFTSQHKLVQQNCAPLRNPNPSDPVVVEAIKVLVRVCAETADVATLAADAEDNPISKKRLVDSAQTVRGARVTLITAAKEATQFPQAIPKLVEAGNNLLLQFSWMISLCPLASSNCPQILDEAFVVAENLKKMVTALKNSLAAKDPAVSANGVASAKSYISTVSDSVKALLSTIKQLGPSQRQCEEARNVLTRVSEDLTAAAFAASLNEVPPCPRPITEIKAEISNQLKELAAAMQKFNIQQDTNVTQFSPTVDSLGQIAPRLANSVKLLASTHPTPASQVDILLLAREVISALAVFVTIVKNVGADLEQPTAITAAAQAVQVKLVDLVNALKSQDVGIAECDAAMNAIGGLLGSLSAPQPNPQLPLVKCQEIVANAIKQVVTSLSALSKAQKAAPDTAIGEHSKALGDGILALIRAGTASVHYFMAVNPTLAQNLLFNTKEVAISVGNYLQFSKNAALNPKDPNTAAALDNGVKAATVCISKFVAVQKEFAALKA